MAVLLQATAEPLSLAARTDTPPHPGDKPAPATILAHSRAADVLTHELERYCEGHLRGRSFLIAGHRGSGKTTLVDGVLLQLQQQALARKVRLKPLPVYVQGPQLFDPNGGATDPRPPATPTPGPVGATGPTGMTVALAVAGALPEAAARPAEGEDSLERRVLIQVAQGLHQAVAREYVDRFHLHARRRAPPGSRQADEAAELAARFQIELNEAPPPSRLQEFWNQARLTHEGLLFDSPHGRGRQQGLREMVALNGVSHVYQRIAGKLVEKEERLNTGKRSSETPAGAEPKWAELVKPLGALATGGAVGVAGVGAGQGSMALLLGLLAALGAALVFKLTGTVTRQRERKVDRTFMPDLTTKTLHRVMPELFERLLGAGLAPVFIVDELDKVDDLYDCMHRLLDNLKKLFAERAFTCLLVDRGFYEQLHWREEQERQR